MWGSLVTSDTIIFIDNNLNKTKYTAGWNTNNYASIGYIIWSTVVEGVGSKKGMTMDSVCNDWKAERHTS